MLCLIVVKVVPPQKINNLQIEVVKFCPTLLWHQMKNVKYQDNFADTTIAKIIF